MTLSLEFIYLRLSSENDLSFSSVYNASSYILMATSTGCLSIWFTSTEEFYQMNRFHFRVASHLRNRFMVPKTWWLIFAKCCFQLNELPSYTAHPRLKNRLCVTWWALPCQDLNPRHSSLRFESLDAPIVLVSIDLSETVKFFQI